ncbi:MAG: galactose-1-phosphate uridylyltransferase [Eggerthellaceae bacterium]|jgi:UDPglucose--hexose-1-phosphate uridylyltransferase
MAVNGGPNCGSATEGVRAGDPARALVAYARSSNLIAQGEERWAYNTVLAVVGAHSPSDLPAGFDASAAAEAGTEPRSIESEQALDACLHALFQIACETGAWPTERENAPADAEAVPAAFTARLFGCLMPRPAQIRAGFWQRYAESPQAACNWFYRLCCASRYVSAREHARNLRWRFSSPWGPLEITVNLAKPEKDPRMIAQAAEGHDTANSTGPTPYPLCRLCAENEGYAGRDPAVPGGGWPARANLRSVPLVLGGEPWYLQYSPQEYFDEHCIVLSREHRPMVIDRAHLGCLLEFVAAFPHYFMGSNADLPIVGGSILSHDHFQGGKHRFPLMRAPLAQAIPWQAFPQVSLGVVKWPVSVLRLCSTEPEPLLDAATVVLDAWRSYTDTDAGIIAADADGTPHNTLTPIAYRAGERFVLDLALRCNVTSEEHPLGVFHPHAPLQHIKKENIGLIEVMGLAILPGRLERELGAVAKALSQGTVDALSDDPLGSAHARWAHEVAARHDFAREDVHQVLREEVGQVFAQVLADAGVFKDDERGHAAFTRFLHLLSASD